MRLNCPWCGERDSGEFAYGGDAAAVRPDEHTPSTEPAEVIDAAWMRYVFLRENPRGAHVERWHHVAGCRQWLVVHRDTATHAVTHTELVGGNP